MAKLENASPKIRFGVLLGTISRQKQHRWNAPVNEQSFKSPQAQVQNSPIRFLESCLCWNNILEIYDRVLWSGKNEVYRILKNVFWCKNGLFHPNCKYKIVELYIFIFTWQFFWKVWMTIGYPKKTLDFATMLLSKIFKKIIQWILSLIQNFGKTSQSLIRGCLLNLKYTSFFVWLWNSAELYHISWKLVHLLYHDHQQQQIWIKKFTKI